MAAAMSGVASATWCTPSPRRAKKRATPLSSFSGSSSSMKQLPASKKATRTPSEGTSSSRTHGSPSTCSKNGRAAAMLCTAMAM